MHGVLRRRRTRVTILALLVPACATLLAQAPAADPVTRLGRYVEDYYTRAQSIVAEETVAVQVLDASFAPVGSARRTTYELRVEWDPRASAETRATTVRQLLKTSGPKLFDSTERCGDPDSTTPEPLAFLLPDNQAKWKFVMGRPARVDGRPAMTIDYSQRETQPPKVTAKECLPIDLGEVVGRVWADASTAEILRVEKRLPRSAYIKIPKEFRDRDAPVDVTIEQWRWSVRYKRAVFHDPDDAILLPTSIESMLVHRNAEGTTRLRTTQTFAKYRRFVTESRLIP